jgi:hypothetical protein
VLVSALIVYRASHTLLLPWPLLLLLSNSQQMSQCWEAHDIHPMPIGLAPFKFMLTVFHYSPLLCQLIPQSRLQHTQQLSRAATQLSVLFCSML